MLISLARFVMLLCFTVWNVITLMLVRYAMRLLIVLLRMANACANLVISTIPRIYVCHAISWAANNAPQPTCAPSATLTISGNWTQQPTNVAAESITSRTAKSALLAPSAATLVSQPPNAQNAIMANIG